MTEAEWLACDKFKPMFELYCERGTDRQFRLFAAACARHTIHLLLDEFRADGLRALEVVERSIEGRATAEDLDEAAVFHGCDSQPECAACVVEMAVGTCRRADAECRQQARDAANQAVNACVEAAVYAALMDQLKDVPPGVHPMDWLQALQDSPDGQRQEEAEQELRTTTRLTEKARQATLLRDVFGNPFRPAHAEPAWLTWNDGTVVRMAKAIHDERRFDELPMLGDALEDAGCTDADILTHCRGPGPHVRGCWVVDLLVGKAK